MSKCWEWLVHLLSREVCLYPLWIWLLWIEVFVIVAVVSRWGF